MNDNFFIVLFIVITLLVIIIFIYSSNKSKIKNSKFNLINSIFNIKITKQKNKLTYQDALNASDSLSSVAALL